MASYKKNNGHNPRNSEVAAKNQLMVLSLQMEHLHSSQSIHRNDGRRSSPRKRRTSPTARCEGGKSRYNRALSRTTGGTQWFGGHSLPHGATKYTNLAFNRRYFRKLNVLTRTLEIKLLSILTYPRFLRALAIRPTRHGCSNPNSQKQIHELGIGIQRERNARK